MDSTGALRWSFDLPGAPFVTPTVLDENGQIYFGAGTNLIALASSLRPAKSGWNTSRANARRTGQWLNEGRNRPFLSSAELLQNGAVRIMFNSESGTTYEVQESTDLQMWIKSYEILAMDRMTVLTLEPTVNRTATFVRIWQMPPTGPMP